MGELYKEIALLIRNSELSLNEAIGVLEQVKYDLLIDGLEIGDEDGSEDDF